MNIFEQAARLAIRFETPQGNATVEDLFNMHLTSNTGRANLDDIAKGLHKELHDSAEIASFVDPTKSGANDLLQLKFDVVKHVIDVRVAERTKALDAAKRREEKQKILAIMAEKKDEALKGKSLEELQALVEAL